MRKLETKSVAFEVKSVDGDGSTFSGIAAAFNNIDYRGDILHPNAYDKHMDSFREFGVVRDEHQVTTGKITDARVQRPDGLLVSGRISDTTAGRDQKTLLRDNVVQRLSIGHFVIGKQYLESSDEVRSYWDSVGYKPSDDDLAASGSGSYYGIRLITEAEPAEVSTTFIPMNDRARITDVKSVAGQPVGRTFDAHSDETLAVLEEYHERATRLFEKRSGDGRSLSPRHLAAFDRLSRKLASLLEAAGLECKGAVAFSAAPVVEGEWDAAAAKKRLKDWAGDDMAKYRKGFAWYDAAKSDDVGSYKLPHHDVEDGKLVTNKRGVEAAMGALDGARGGASIPDGDKPKVRAHLAKHYAQWGGKPPEAESGEKSRDATDLYSDYLTIVSRLNGAHI